MLGAEIRAVRERRGITVTDCAQRAGIAESTLKKLESGSRYPSLDTLEKVATCLRINFVVTPTETYLEDTVD